MRAKCALLETSHIQPAPLSSRNVPLQRQRRQRYRGCEPEPGLRNQKSACPRKWGRQRLDKPGESFHSRLPPCPYPPQGRRRIRQAISIAHLSNPAVSTQRPDMSGRFCRTPTVFYITRRTRAPRALHRHCMQLR